MTPTLNKVVCIGDQLTEGGGVDTAYPRLLQNKLVVAGGIWDVINAGVIGDTTAQMLARFPTDVVAKNPSYVLIMGGANDPWNAPATLANIEAMCGLAVAAGIQPVLILMTPVGTVVEGAINSGITSYGALMGYPVIDFYSPLNDPNNPGNLAAQYVSYGIQPNQLGFAVLVNSINVTNEETFKTPANIENIEFSVPFTWCGLQWVVHTQQISGAYIDTTTNYLHMIIQLIDGVWPWVDIVSLQAVHPGVYQLTMVTDISAMILGTAPGFAGGMPNLGFAMYICDEHVAPFRGEIGIEPCQWGNPENLTMSWIQDNPMPDVDTGIATFVDVRGPNVTHTLTWNPLYVKWEADGGITDHVELELYNNTVVTPPIVTSPIDTGNMFLRLMLSNSLNGGDFPEGTTQIEIILSNFELHVTAPLEEIPKPPAKPPAKQPAKATFSIIKSDTWNPTLPTPAPRGELVKLGGTLGKSPDEVTKKPSIDTTRRVSSV